MNRRILIIVVCALVLSVCASYLVYRAVGSRAGTGRTVQTTPVIVASRDIDAGSLIRNIDLKTTAWTGTPPKGAIAKPDSILNRGVASPIYEGEPITETRLAQQGSGGGLAGTIPSGMRACAVKVNEVVGVAGFVVPGMRVDVLITGMPPGGNPLDGPRVRTLLQNIQVLSAGTNFQRDQEGKPEQAQVVNLLVTPAQAEILSLASNETRIQLDLRNPMDTEVQRTPGTMVSDLFGAARAQETASPVPAQGGSPPVRPVTPASPTRANPAPVTQTPVTQLSAIPMPANPPVPTPAAPGPFIIEQLNGSTRTQASFNSAQERQ